MMYTLHKYLHLLRNSIMHLRKYLSKCRQELHAKKFTRTKASPEKAEQQLRYLIDMNKEYMRNACYHRQTQVSPELAP